MQGLLTALRKSLVLRMTLGLSAFLVVFLFAFSALVYNYFENELKNNISEQQTTLLTAIANGVDHKLELYLAVIEDVAKEITPQTVNDRKLAQAFLDRHPGTRRVFSSGLHLMTADGRMIACSPCKPGELGSNLAHLPSIRKVIESGSSMVSAAFANQSDSGAPSIGFLAPVRDKSGKFIAILGGRVNLHDEAFLGELLHLTVARTGYVYIFATDRTYIMHPDKSRILTRSFKVGVNRLFDSAIEGFEGTGRVVTSYGVDSLSTYKRLSKADWIVASNYPVADAYAPIEKIKKIFVSSVLFGAVCMVVVVRLIMKRFSQTMVSFAEHVSRAADETGERKFFGHDSPDEIGVLVNKFNSMVALEEQRKAELLHASTHDALTGLYNRAFFDSELERVAKGRLAPVSILIADLDDLKKCNDKLGHPVGDELIRAAARALTESFRGEDVVARIGGDEFAAILPGVGREGAIKATIRIRTAVASSAFRADGLSLSISIGWATAESADMVEAAFTQADQQMYQNKINKKTMQTNS